MWAVPVLVIGFNEAEALKPRIRLVASSPPRSSLVCFNEAEALKPRIPEYADGKYDITRPLQ